MSDEPSIQRQGSERPLPPFPAQVLERPALVSKFEISAAVLSLAWIAASYTLPFLAPASEGAEGGTAWAPLALAALPAAAIWAAALAARKISDLRAEADELRRAIDAMRISHAQQVQAAAAQARARPERSEPPPARAATPTPTLPLARPAPDGVSSGQPELPSEDQSALALGTAADEGRAPMAIDEFIRALNFPDSGEDVEGIRCLRLALQDREAARLIRATQDVLTLLAQDGIFVDDLRPDRAKPELWRRFAQGERGRSIAALGGIRDRSSIALTTGRMRTDTIFRDAAHHFLRQFDRSFQAFERHAEDQDLIELSDTRTVRAFMLLGRVTGVFD